MAEQKEQKKHCFCPYCDSEMMEPDVPFCQACKLAILYCPQCQKSLPRGNKICPHCGAEIQG